MYKATQVSCYYRRSAFLVAVLIFAAPELTDGPYRGTRKETGALFHVPHQILPTLAVDVGWSESYRDIFDDMNRLLIRNEGKTKVAIIMKMIRHSGLRVSGVVELYGWTHKEFRSLNRTNSCFLRPPVTLLNHLTSDLANFVQDKSGPGVTQMLFFPYLLGSYAFMLQHALLMRDILRLREGLWSLLLAISAFTFRIASLAYFSIILLYLKGTRYLLHIRFESKT